MQELPDGNAGATAVIGSYPSSRQAHEAGLAVLASGHHYWVQPEDGRYLLIVPRRNAGALQREVEHAERINRYWPPSSLELPAKSVRKLPTFTALGILIFVFYFQHAFQPLKDLGSNSSEHVLHQGQWWRIVTAITLHADLSHLAGNLLGLSIFSYLACRYMGNGLAWVLILLTASLSNLTNDLLHIGEPYFSLGASTAVFSALGLIAGFPFGCYMRSREPIQTRDWLIPFVGGCVLFAWMGGGDFPTDVPGHLWSFLYGLAAALIVAACGIPGKLSKGTQRALLAAALLVLAAAWLWALSEGMPEPENAPPNGELFGSSQG